MMNKKNIVLFLCSACITLCLSSCQVVKGYQKMYLNDADMKLSPRETEVFDTSFETYREGASGSGGGKVGGGCGCN